MDDILLSVGEEAFAKLAQRAVEINGLIASNFPAATLQTIQAEFEGQLGKSASTPNERVAALGALVREQAALTIEDIKACEMWLFIKVPEVSDGNNFGVDVQNFVAGELKALRAEAATMMDSVSTYHQARATGLEKIVKTPSSTTDEETKTETDDGKTTKKSSKVEKTSTKTEAPLADAVKHVAALDVKEYHACYSRLTDLRNAYVKASLILGKNKKRLADPRGDGEGSRSNVMSMF